MKRQKNLMGIRDIPSLILILTLLACLFFSGCSDSHSVTYYGAGAGVTGNNNNTNTGTTNPAPVIVTPVVVTNP
jgi:hypothetical protein